MRRLARTAALVPLLMVGIGVLGTSPDWFPAALILGVLTAALAIAVLRATATKGVGVLRRTDHRRQPYQEPCMGTWGTGPFDNDLAADFVDELQGLTFQQVIDVLERAFQRVTDSGERVDGADRAEAVAAGALLASTPLDSPIVIDPDDGSREPLPGLPASLRASARLAPDRVLQDRSKMATGWVDSADADQWRQEARQILQALETPADH